MPTVEFKPEQRVNSGDEFHEVILSLNKVNVFYDQLQAIKEISCGIHKNKITSIIGPSGCGKSTLLRCINRLNDLIDIARIGRGDVRVHGIDI